jgi:hypothetical protein
MENVFAFDVEFIGGVVPEALFRWDRLPAQITGHIGDKWLVGCNTLLYGGYRFKNRAIVKCFPRSRCPCHLGRGLRTKYFDGRLF